jgi:hypothetical protein
MWRSSLAALRRPDPAARRSARPPAWDSPAVTAPPGPLRRRAPWRLVTQVGDQTRGFAQLCGTRNPVLQQASHAMRRASNHGAAMRCADRNGGPASGAHCLPDVRRRQQQQQRRQLQPPTGQALQRQPETAGSPMPAAVPAPVADQQRSHSPPGVRRQRRRQPPAEQPPVQQRPAAAKQATPKAAAAPTAPQPRSPRPTGTRRQQGQQQQQQQQRRQKPLQHPPAAAKQVTPAAALLLLSVLLSQLSQLSLPLLQLCQQVDVMHGQPHGEGSSLTAGRSAAPAAMAAGGTPGVLSAAVPAAGLSYRTCSTIHATSQCAPHTALTQFMTCNSSHLVATSSNSSYNRPSIQDVCVLQRHPVLGRPSPRQPTLNRCLKRVAQHAS